MLTDSHCHLDKVNLDLFDGSIETMLSHARQAGVSQFLCVCIDMEHFEDVHQIARNFDDVYCSIGLHPTHQDGLEPDVQTLIRYADYDFVVAIGETGLDNFHFKKDADMSWQKDRFRTHISAAKETGKPLIIHMRDAREDTIKILQEEKADEVGGVMHCFAEDWETAQQALDLGFYISFSGIVTFNSAKKLQEVARNVPEDRMLIETDSPWLAPVPNRGKPNQPAYVEHVAQKLAELRETDYMHIGKVTTQNFNTLFNI
jgi:TatD DNase family protein